MKKVAKGKVTFLKSPTGTHKLAYSIGDVAELEKSLCVELIKKGIAEPVSTKTGNKEIRKR